MPAAPLPVRNGLNPTRLRLPADGHWASVLDYLHQRFPDDRARLSEKVAAGEVVDGSGRPLGERAPYVAGAFVYLYRDPPVETRAPFGIDVLHRDENLLVVDKPPFLASTPRGVHVVESALVRLRCELGLPELSPVHRLDRLTAGVLVFTVRAEVRGAYQSLFDQRVVHKQYEARAGYDPALAFPRTVHSRIVKQRGVLAAQQLPGPANAETVIDLLAAHGDVATYRLSPTTGKTHQLRVHMNALGVPIINDNFYPRFYDVAVDDYSAPLQLLARSIAFTDPFSGARRCFASKRGLGTVSIGK
ncbi:MAG: pseudouridine synthase [Mycobacteriaceae bacterium]